MAATRTGWATGAAIDSGAAGLHRGSGENRSARHGVDVNVSRDRGLGYGTAGGEVFLAHRGDADGAVDVSDVGDIDDVDVSCLDDDAPGGGDVGYVDPVNVAGLVWYQG